MQFDDLKLSEPILRAVKAEGYTTATPIQAQTIPYTLEGRDVLGCAQTGTGKTAAFALPVLHRLTTVPRGKGSGKAPRCLVLCPTRELATQIAESFQAYGKNLKIRGAVVFGGVNQHPQVQKLRQGIDILVATPGRLLDLMNQGHVDLSAIETLVLDEADRMLDMGFINDIKKIVSKTPENRQTLLFSATMPTAIRQLVKTMLRNPAEVMTAPQSTTAERVEQSVYFVDKKHKPDMLAHLLKNLPVTRAIVFTRTKHGADKVVRNLYRAGITSSAIHGNKTQAQRQRSLDGFRGGKVHVLIATDIASRGIDVDGVSHVFNYDLSNDPESYVHRIGRTARAGAHGRAISFCDAEEREHLAAIQRVIRMDIPVADDHPAEIPVSDAPVKMAAGSKPRGNRNKASRPSHPQGNRNGGGFKANDGKPRRRRRNAAAQR